MHREINEAINDMLKRIFCLFIIGALIAACGRQHEPDAQTAARCLEEAEAALASDSIRAGETLLRRAIRLSEEAEDWHTNYIAYQQLALSMSQSNPEEALRLMKRALRVYEQHPDDEHNQVILLDYAGTYAAQVAFVTEGSYDEALDFIRRAYDLARQHQMTDLQCQTLTSLANIAWAKEDYRQAVSYARQAASLITPFEEYSGDSIGGDVSSRRLGADVSSRRIGADVSSRRKGGDVSSRRKGGDVSSHRDLQAGLLSGALQVLARSYLSLNMLDSAENLKGDRGTCSCHVILILLLFHCCTAVSSAGQVSVFSTQQSKYEKRFAADAADIGSGRCGYWQRSLPMISPPAANRWVYALLPTKARPLTHEATPYLPRSYALSPTKLRHYSHIYFSSNRQTFSRSSFYRVFCPFFFSFSTF